MDPLTKIYLENVGFDAKDWLKAQDYKINKEDGSIFIEGDVKLWGLKLTKIPFNFSEVTGDFECEYNRLESLVGCPRTVGGDFLCHENKLTTLEGAPRTVGGKFVCTNMYLTSLKGGPEIVGGDFFCRYDALKSLDGLPDVRGKIIVPEKFSEEDIAKALETARNRKYVKTLSYDDEMPDVADIFD